ncbi:ABC transporter C family member 13 [Phytophthora citrophthora]|uniref:ABC transporter C family member 13 n=1 Tax=Phytophthora citrophthora TaxID=4793 RepID=A0AAD9LQ38_9STRA|nr:ABC transporter C family member 13 [Phytophthora citrophthora]
MSCSSMSMSLSPDSMSLSMDSLPAELRGDPIVMMNVVPPTNPFVQGERREYGFYGLEQDGALRPGGQVALLTRRTIGLLLNYAGIGALYGGINTLIVPFLSNYLQLQQYQVRGASSVLNMVWNFKAFGGLLTDSLRICGYRRKPYLVFGWLLCFATLLYLGASDMPIAGNTEAAWRYLLFMTVGTIGYFLANVAADAIVVEIAQREPLPTRGHTQVSIYAARMTGAIIMDLFVGGTLNGPSYGGSFSWSLDLNQVLLVLAGCSVIPLLGSILFLHEDPTAQTVPVFAFSNATSCPVIPRHHQPDTAPLDPPLDFGERCQLIWRLMQSRAMWQLLMFELVASFCLTMDSNAVPAIEANWVGVDSWPKTIALAVWSLAFIGGLFMTRNLFLRGSWVHLYCIATFWVIGVDVVTVACTVFDVVRTRSFWLYMQVLAAPATALRFLVQLFPIVEIAPRGIEGTTYGLVITFRNMAIPLGTTAYKAINSYFSVSDEDLHRDSDSVRLQVAYTYLIAWAFQFLSMAFIGLLPRQKLEVQQLRYYGGYSTSGGWLIVVVLFILLVFEWQVVQDVEVKKLEVKIWSLDLHATAIYLLRCAQWFELIECSMHAALSASRISAGISVLNLAGRPCRSLSCWSELHIVLYVVHLLTTIAVMGCSIAVAGVATLHHSSALLVIGASVATAAWFFYIVEMLLEFRQHKRGCKVITLVLVLSTVEELALQRNSPESDLLVVLEHWKAVIAVAGAVLAVLRLLITTGNDEVDETIEKIQDTRESPLDRAGWLSQFSYHWISPFIKLGKQRRLEMEDVPYLPRRDTTSVAAAVFEKELQSEFQTHQPSKRSFLRVVRRLYGFEVFVFAVWSTVNKAIGLASPLLLKLFLDWADSSNPSLYKGYVLAAAMVGRSILSAVSGTQYNLAWKRFDLRVRAGLVSAIYARTLELSGREKRQAGGIGRITNLLSVDVGRIVGMPSTLFDMVLIPAEIAVALILLSQVVSVAFVAGIAVLAVMLPLQTVLGRKIQSVTTDMMQFRDERVGLTAESLKAIRTLKLLGWVISRLESMSKSRSLEMGRLQVRKYLDAFCVFFWASTPVIVQVSVFATAVFSGRDISAADAFTAIALLDRLIFPMNYFPWIINGFLEARVSALRIRGFLFDKENGREKSTSEAFDKKDGNICIRDCEFTWGSRRNDDTENDETSAETPLLLEECVRLNPFVLRINELDLRPGTYVVCGPVGAGKSSLLLALLGEMPLRSSSIASFLRIKGSSCSYAPQSPWLFRGTVEVNITLCNGEGGKDSIDRSRYERVLRACELNVDLRSMKKSYSVAENGSNFSGGQRARINLARALYQQSSLYLLDDPLSGLDVTTASKVVTNCFMSGSNIFPEEAAVVIVTHSLHLLPLFPSDAQIVVMDEGRIIEQGTYSILRTKDPPSRLMNLLKSSPTEDPSEDTSVPDTEPKPEEATDSSSETDHTSTTEEEEHRESGVVGWHVWKAYSLDVGWALSVVILISVAAMQVSRNAMDWWIAVYTNGKHSITPREFAMVLLYIAGANIVAVFSRSFLFAYGGLRAARATYNKLVRSVFAAPLRFFERTPTGRVLNRLSGDTYAVDESLPFIFNIFLKDAADVMGALVILFYGNRLVLGLLVPLSILYFHLQRDYRPSSRHLKRLDAATQSPLLAMFTDTLDGLTVIRAARKQQQYAYNYGVRLNSSQKVSFLGSTTGAWFGLRLDMLGVCVTSFVAVFAVVDFNVTGTVNPGVLGLTLTYALPIVGKLNSILNSFVDTERQMIAVERVKEYTDLEPEEDEKLVRTTEIQSTWPTAGHISIKALTVTYGPSISSDHKFDAGWEWVGPREAAPALKYVTFDVPPGQKLGICGRTGAGKSTLLNALFRAVPWERSGSILIDNVPLDSLNLQDLRSRLTYIPQDVVLFSGTVRSNLDPSGEMTDERLWTVLRKCHGLANAIAKLENGLDTIVEGGAEEQAATFSQGQAQLLCIARALLRPSKVLCIDEATASIDQETERAISDVISSEFATSTVLTVAHRIHTIMHCDRVLLLDNGRIAESGDPKELANNSQSLFYRLVNSYQSKTELL